MLFSPFDSGLKYGLDRFLVRFTHKAMHCIVHKLVFCTVRPSNDPPSGLSIDLCDLMTVPDLLSRGKKWLSWGSLAYLHACTSSAINQLISPGCGLVDGHWLRDNRGPLDRERKLSELVKDSASPSRPLFINKCCSVQYILNREEVLYAWGERDEWSGLYRLPWHRIQLSFSV